MGNCFWQLEHLSDQRLLEGLQVVLRTQRRALAELIAHLGEVEERRLHLQAACGSLFSYCVQRLGMSEDEACRRIELARLARKFPVLFAELASGGISLSVALLLKRVLSPDNHRELIAAVRGCSARQASELLAARFPSPDVPACIRKLPEPRGAGRDPEAAPLLERTSVSVAVSTVALIPEAQAAPHALAPTVVPHVARSTERSAATELASNGLVPNGGCPLQLCPPQHAVPAEPSRSSLRQRIEPLSVGRYRVQFTADASLKHKLEQARDLLRHAEPSGDFGAIVSRALDLLLDDLMRRRFGVRKEGSAKRKQRAAVPHATAATAITVSGGATPPVTDSAKTLVATTPSTAVPPTGSPLVMPSASSSEAQRTAAPPRIARAARRAVLERDGLGCSWVDGDGHRCGSTAWLELDHRHPAGKGGSGEPENLRLLCRAHNRWAAERAYGRAHVERAIRARREPAAPAPS